MSTGHRSSRRKSLSLLLGLGAAGCMPQLGGQPSARQEVSPTREPARQVAPSLAPTDNDAERTRVVVDTVNESVDRVSRILEQRAQAQQAAMDLRELRGAQEAKAGPDDTKAATEATLASKTTDDASTIERLAAALRKGESIDPIPVAKPVQPAPAADPATGANEPISSSAGASVDEQVDLGDAQPAGMRVKPFANDVNAALAGRPEMRMDRPADRNVPRGTAAGALAGSPAATPAVVKSNVDPMLLVQQQFASKVESDPRDMASQLELQLLRFLKDEPVPAMEDLSALPADDRELLASLCDALANFRSIVKADVAPLNSEKARPFLEMADRISARSDLTIGALTLCEGVRAFGLYDPIEPLQFTEGTPRKSVLYCEVDGFLSQLNDKQMWETRLSLSLQLYDERGMRVWNMPAEPVVDVSRKRRRDFFIAKLVTLPPNLRAGHYLLKASVKDGQANRIAESTIQFDVLAK